MDTFIVTARLKSFGTHRKEYSAVSLTAEQAEATYRKEFSRHGIESVRVATPEQEQQSLAHGQKFNDPNVDED
jgi:hypothetical protein